MNTKALLLLLGVAMTMSAFSIGRSDTTEEFKAQLAKAAPKPSSHSAGMLEVPAKGRIAIVSSQNVYTVDELSGVAKLNGHQIRFPIDIVSEKAFKIEEANAYRVKSKLGIAIFVVNQPDLPLSLIAMEERWAMINAGKVAAQQGDSKIKCRRFQRELTRVLRALLIAGSTDKDGKAVENGNDLEAIDRDPLDAQTLLTMIRSVPSFGLTPPRRVPYHRACQEGWAPAPTNDVQKAVWNKIHQLPTEPIKIKPETKKVRE